MSKSFWPCRFFLALNVYRQRRHIINEVKWTQWNFQQYNFWVQQIIIRVHQSRKFWERGPHVVVWGTPLSLGQKQFALCLVLFCFFSITFSSEKGWEGWGISLTGFALVLLVACQGFLIYILPFIMEKFEKTSRFQIFNPQKSYASVFNLCRP